MASSLMSDYFGRGELSARPVSPNVPTGCCAFYYATDVNKAYIYDGSVWKELGAPGGTGITIVQTKMVSVSDVSAGITLDAAPTQGNTLLALTLLAQNAASQNNTGDGWSRVAANVGNTGIAPYLKTVGAGASATQDPVVDAVAGVIFMAEIEGGVGIGLDTNAPIGLVNSMNYIYSLAGSLSNYTMAYNSPGVPVNGLILLIGGRRANNDAGVFSGSGSDLASVLGGGTNPSAAVRAIPVERGDTPSVTHTWSGAATTFRAAILLTKG